MSELNRAINNPIQTFISAYPYFAQYTLCLIKYYTVFAG